MLLQQHAAGNICLSKHARPLQTQGRDDRRLLGFSNLVVCHDVQQRAAGNGCLSQNMPANYKHKTEEGVLYVLCAWPLLAGRKVLNLSKTKGTEQGFVGCIKHSSANEGNRGCITHSPEF